VVDFYSTHKYNSYTIDCALSIVFIPRQTTYYNIYKITEKTEHLLQWSMDMFNIMTLAIFDYLY